MSLSPRSVLITGANRGLGLELAKQFLQLSSPPQILFAGCRSPDKSDELKKLATQHASLRLLQLDVDSDESIEAARVEVEGQVGDVGLNLLLNNAAINNQERGLQYVTRDKLNQHFNTNITSQMMMAKAFRPLLKKAADLGAPDTFSCTKSAIINTSSCLGLIGYVQKRNDLRYPYCASKCGLNMATAILANELSPEGILVVSLHPGWVKTDMGGPNGQLEIEDSISQCMKTFASLDKSASGRLVCWNGHFYCWSDTD